MPRKKQATAKTKYIARSRRAEKFGIVEQGTATELPGLSSEEIAWLLWRGYYIADGPVPDEVQEHYKVLAG